ncbi:peptidoglycan recognition protein family protein [Clostridium intestinale]|uniref:Peptidoglycan-binding domain-containing protein n=1 Tax=Clostridium intestinale TaxID=36845 RepID=A0A7D6VU51_9CLOT|nr:peptidoglycan-binding domain-containing protein [Clostridium intestinale]QLY79172.1 peptidoglycan-binding domain-containing protein [Clostridium intestinale]
MNIINVNLSFGSLSKRGATNKIIGHHADAFNCSVQDIHSWHKNNGWSGIGYHLFIRRNGEVYQGRPLDTLGAHTLNQNSDSVGICLEGRLTQEKPTQAQINSLKEVLSYLRGIYGNLPFKGHMDYMATDCPGTLMEYMGELNGTKTPVPTQAPETPKKTIDNNGWTAKVQAECNAQGFSNQIVDNIPGPNTLAGCPLIKFGASGKITALVQERLNKLGFNCGSVDGIFGEKTRAAVITFQTSRGLSADGVVGQNTWRKLLGL